jgi:LytR cell envelope-related transcriptional attenuator
MARKAAGGSHVLDWTLAALFIVIVALGVSTALRVGPQAMGRPKRPVRIELLNGSGRSGLAGELASYLRDGGFDVLLVSNADRSDYRNTLVVNRSDSPEPGNSVADYLGTRHLIQQIRAQEMIDVTVIVGRDARHWMQPR